MFYTATSRMPALRDSLDGMRQVNRMFNQAFGPHVNGSDGDGTLASAWVPPCDIYENEATLKLVMEIPGIAASDIKVSLENGRISVRGEKRQLTEEQTDRVHRYERSYGTFERSFTLPTTVDPDKIEAKIEQGILTLQLPKVERARPREIPVVTAG